LAYFAYLEDVDLAARLARAGYGARLVPDAVSWHQGSASAGPTSPLKTFLVARNRRILFRLEAPDTLGAAGSTRSGSTATPHSCAGRESHATIARRGHHSRGARRSSRRCGGSAP
jgi:GT2 family glycosyltransferase